MCKHTWQNNSVFMRRRNSKPVTCYKTWKVGGFSYDFKQESIFILLIFVQLLPDVLLFYTIRAQTSQRVQHTEINQKPPQSQQEKQSFAQCLAAS